MVIIIIIKAIIKKLNDLKIIKKFIFFLIYAKIDSIACLFNIDILISFY